MDGGAEESGPKDDELLSELTIPAEPAAPADWPAPGNASLAGCLGDRYEILERLGSGAFGEVYRARDRVLHREVAIKRIRLDAFADPQQLLEVEHRLVREAQVAARLRHPGIVTTHDIVSSASSSFIVMEYVAGRTLERLLEERGRLDLPGTIRLLGQVAAALDHAHAAGVVHRDVKPSNIVVEPSGHVKVMDFGIARIDSARKLTATGAIVGTPNYMSPEQARGGTVDGRSDLFSLGCVLYECLTGLRPFEADNVTGILLRVVTEPPPAVDFAALGLPSAVGDVLTRAVAKLPAERFASGAELIAAARAAAGEHVPAPVRPAAGDGFGLAAVARPRPAPRLSRWVPWTAGAACVAGLALAAWIAADPHTGAPAVSGTALVAPEPRGLLDRLLRREPRLRITIAEGTWLRLALESPLSSQDAAEGQPVAAVTTNLLRVGGIEAVPKGTRVAGRVERAASAQRASGRGELTLVFEALELDGERIALQTKPLTMRAPAPPRKEARRNRVLGAVGGLIDRIKGGSNTEGGSAGTVTVVSAGGRDIALRDGARLAVELTAAATVTRAPGRIPAVP